MIVPGAVIDEMPIERKDFGIGLGLASFGGTERALQPSGSLRLGSLDRLSLRADYRYPEAGMGLIGGPRIGVGLNQGRSRKAGLLVGVATTPVPDSARRVGGFVELAFPLSFVTRKAGLSVSGFLSGKYHGNEDKQGRSCSGHEEHAERGSAEEDPDNAARPINDCCG